MQAKMENVVKSGESKNSNYWNCIQKTSHKLLTIKILDMGYLLGKVKRFFRLTMLR
jgi:hypothetical protein